MGLKVSFGTQGALTDSWVDATLAQRLKALYPDTVARFIDVNDKPMNGALQDLVVNGVNQGDWYRDDAPTADFSTTYLVDKRWGIRTDRVDGVLVYDLNAGWNGVKNISIRSDVADQVVADGFVNFDADYSAVTSGINSFTAVGVKRGNFLGGSGVDIVNIETLTNVNKYSLKAGGILNFNIATGAGNDIVTVRPFDFNGEYSAGDSTYDKGWFGFDLADETGKYHATYVDLGTGNDTFVDSSQATDNVWGGAGRDQIDTGTGNDYLNGGAGNDFLVGGVGSDTFAFTETGYGIDTIQDFSSNAGDKLLFSSALFANADAVLANAYQRGADLWIDPGNDGVGDIVILKNTTLSGLHTGDIVIA